MPLDFIGQGWDVINVAVAGAATDTAITYTRAVKSFAYWSRNQKQFTVKKAVADTKFATIFQGERLDSKVIVSDANVASSALGFVTITDGTADVIEGFVTY